LFANFQTLMQSSDVVLVAGDETLIGAALLRQLTARGFVRLCGYPAKQPDLADAADVERLFSLYSPAYVFHAAGASAGIAANQKYPATLMRHNLAVTLNIIDAAHRHGVRKLLYLASSCCYPRLCPQPMAVGELMTGQLEPTNGAYATAKLAGLKLTEAYRAEYGADFIAAIPANSFGPGDDFDPDRAHVVGALIHRMHQAKLEGAPTVEVWGTGNARREFIFADDLAEACIFVMQNYSSPTPINIGGGADFTIRESAEMIRDVVGYNGDLVFDASRPEGMPRKVLDARPLAALGWAPRTSARRAIEATYRAYLSRLNATDHSATEVVTNV
jgi:GDP-L-fucose synthase